MIKWSVWREQQTWVGMSTVRRTFDMNQYAPAMELVSHLI